MFCSTRFFVSYVQRQCRDWSSPQSTIPSWLVFKASACYQLLVFVFFANSQSSAGFYFCSLHLLLLHFIPCFHLSLSNSSSSHICFRLFESVLQSAASYSSFLTYHQFFPRVVHSLFKWFLSSLLDISPLSISSPFNFLPHHPAVLPPLWFPSPVLSHLPPWYTLPFTHVLSLICFLPLSLTSSMSVLPVHPHSSLLLRPPSLPPQDTSDKATWPQRRVRDGDRVWFSVLCSKSLADLVLHLNSLISWQKKRVRELVLYRKGQTAN